MTEPSKGQTIQLLRDWHAGDRLALNELIERHLDWMRGYVRRRLGNELRADGETVDYVQDAMVHVLEYGPRFEIEDEDRFRGLLARIVENHLRARHRFLHRQKRDIRRLREVPSDTVLSLDPPARSVTRPSQHAERNERQAWVRLALEFLPPLDREAIWLHEWEELGFREIGERLGISEDAARMRFQRALPKLAKRVQSLQDGQLSDVLSDPGATPEG